MFFFESKTFRSSCFGFKIGLKTDLNRIDRLKQNLKPFETEDKAIVLLFRYELNQVLKRLK